MCCSVGGFVCTSVGQPAALSARVRICGQIPADKYLRGVDSHSSVGCSCLACLTMRADAASRMLQHVRAHTHTCYVCVRHAGPPFPTRTHIACTYAMMPPHIHTHTPHTSHATHVTRNTSHSARRTTHDARVMQHA